MIEKYSPCPKGKYHSLYEECHCDNLSPQPEEWESRFYEKFLDDMRHNNTASLTTVKAFIKNEIRKAEERAFKEGFFMGERGFKDVKKDIR